MAVVACATLSDPTLPACGRRTRKSQRSVVSRAVVEAFSLGYRPAEILATSCDSPIEAYVAELQKLRRETASRHGTKLRAAIAGLVDKDLPALNEALKAKSQPTISPPPQKVAVDEETEHFAGGGGSRSGDPDAAAMFKEAGAATRVSVRTRPNGVDAVELTARFGGGGHARAAGAPVEASLADARRRVLAEAERLVAALGS